jgi:CRISPR-associated endonuclease Cas3-HD
MAYYAHTAVRADGSPDPDESHWQPLADHLRNVAELAAGFAAPFGAADWAANTAWLHDLGKLDSAFQGYLRRENGLDDSEYDSGRVNHSSAGAACVEEELGPVAGRILAYLIAGHHAGLPDWHPSDTGHAALSIRMTEGRENYARIQTEAALTLAGESRLVCDSPAIKAAIQAQLSATSGDQSFCLVTGGTDTPERLHPAISRASIPRLVEASSRTSA